MKRSAAFVGFAVAFVASGIANAQSASCYDAHERGQELRARGEWRRARVAFAKCARATCPSIVAKDCVAFADELAERQPSVLITVVESDGHDVQDARVSIDGVASSDTSLALELDPGVHDIRATAPDGRTIEEKVNLHERERARAVRLTMAPAPSARTPPPPSSASSAGTTGTSPAASAPMNVAPSRAVTTLVLGGVAVAGLATFATFAAMGKTREHELADSCGHRCSKDDISGVFRSYVVADVGLAVAVVATGAALVVWLTRPRDAVPPTQALLRF